MTIAAGIEIGTGGSPAPGLGKALGASHGLGRAEAATQSSQPSIGPGVDSFRTGWQSLLASLASSGNGFAGTRAEADQRESSTGQAPAEAAGEPSGKTATLPAGLGLRLRQRPEQGSEETGAGVRFRPANSWAGEVATRPAAGTEKAAVARAEEKKPATVSKTESSSSARPIYSISIPQPDAAVAEPIPRLVPAAAIVILPEMAQAPVVASAAARSSEPRAQSAPTDISYPYLSSAPPTGLASATIRSHPSNPENLNGAAGPDSQAVRETTEEGETSGTQGQVSVGPNPSKSFSPALSSTDSPKAREDAPQPEPMRVEDEKPPQAGSEARNRTQTFATSPNSIQALSAIRSPVQTFVPGQNRIRPLASSLNSNPAPASSESPSEVSANSRNLIQPPVSGPSPSQVVVPAQSWLEIASPRLDPTETLPPSEETSRTFAGHQNLKQAQMPAQSPALEVVPEQSEAPALLLGQKPVQQPARALNGS
jgi:hypothetical protein